jgi:adenylate cyclase
MIYTKKYLALVLLTVLVFIKISNIDFVKKIENISYDTYQSIFEEESSFENVIIVDIDEKSIGEIGQFPWRRDIFGNLIEKLSEFEAAVIVFDIFFSEKDKQNPKTILNEFGILSNKNIIDSDRILLNKIKNSKVILPVLGDVSVYDKKNNSKPKSNIIFKGTDGSQFLYKFKNKITSLENFNNSAQGIGSISYLDGQDGVLRSIPVLLDINGDVWPALSLETLRVLHNHKIILVSSDENGINQIKTRKYKIQTDPNAIVYINYKKFNKERYVSATDILNGKIDKKFVKDKIILIGSSAQGLFDFVKIPNGKVIPGVETHAHLIENMINDDFIIKNSTTKIAENILLIISLILALFIPSKISPKLSMVFFSTLITLLIVISITFYQFNYFVDVLYIILVSTLLFLTTLYLRYLNENEIALENEKKQLILKKEREIAGEVQKKLFPGAFEDSKLIYARNIPARDVSGDYYDYIRVNDNEIYFTLADVSGKGIKAGILMANASSVFRSLAKLEKPVSTIARYVNNQVSDSSYQGMFITAVIGKINIKTQEIEYINHGHEPIMIFNKDYNFEYIKSSLPPLGIMKFDEDSFFKTTKKNIKDKILLIYTDGVTEGYLKNNNELGVEGFENLIKDNKFNNSKDIIDKVCEILDNRSKLRDDITCLGISIK